MLTISYHTRRHLEQSNRRKYHRLYATNMSQKHLFGGNKYESHQPSNSLFTQGQLNLESTGLGILQNGLIVTIVCGVGARRHVLAYF